MLNRLGLVIHWLGFLAGVATAVYLFINPVEDRIYDTAAMVSSITDGSSAPYVTYESNWLQTAGLFLALLIVATCIGWAFNFILAGHKSPLPWVANKEAEQ